ncbi:hypothetical protein NPIL_693501 [Nephila pilipes]|uniref:Secreted protein n=1 Tax=Nephila pilipes TaxID=299642 RepID=A0A8X6MY37_NEPPI|nr:hypothetical protein NPIL_693501 [Nephila pilipes]
MIDLFPFHVCLVFFVTSVDGLPGPVSEHRLSPSLRSFAKKRSSVFFGCLEAFRLWSAVPMESSFSSWPSSLCFSLVVCVSVGLLFWTSALVFEELCSSSLFGFSRRR